MSELFLPLRAVHMSCAALSILGFALRWVWMLRDSPMLQNRAVKVLPHLVDTLLLLSAIALVGVIGFGPNANWLSVKIAALVLYVVLGTFAIKRGRTKTARFGFGVLAILTFAFIASVARTHDPLGFLNAIARI
jgi:uncharacterized membrane protein SirB2